MIKVGTYNQMKVLRAVEFGVYLDDGNEGILLPKRFVPAGLKPGDEINVFIYHDGDERLIATTQKPKGILGDIVWVRWKRERGRRSTQEVAGDKCGNVL